MVDAASKTIGKYLILQLLGSGGMGEVFLAYDSQLERNVAIKCLRKRQEAEADISRLKREAQFLAKLNHPNIVQLYDFIDEDQQFAIVMELVRGANLTDYLKSKHYTLEQALKWLLQIAKGVQSAHEKGVIHRDLKADNILISENGDVKITDFGIARKFSDPHTHAGKLVGSYSALAPEQALGQPLDHRSDLFALGIMAYRLLCGKHPFGNLQNPAELIKKLLYDEFVPPERFNALPLAFNHLISQLLKKNPEERPGSASIVVKHLEDLLSQAEFRELIKNDNDQFTKTLGYAPASTVQIPKTSTPFTANSKRFKPLAYVGVGLAIFALLILAAIHFWNWGSEWWFRPDEKYVLVIRPELTGSGVENKGDTLLAMNIQNAIEQLIVQLPNHFITQEPSPAEASLPIETLLQRYGATALIKTHVECGEERCEAKASLFSSNRPMKQQRWRFIQFENVASYSITQSNVLPLFDSGSIKKLEKISLTPADYERFLILMREFSLDPVYVSQTLEELEALIDRSPGFEPYYHLYREYSLNAYLETGDKQFLTALRKILAFAELNVARSEPILYHWMELYFVENNENQVSRIIQALEKGAVSQFSLLTAKARLADLKGDFTLAVHYYKNALRIRNDLPAMNNLSELMWLQGDGKSAKAQLEKLLSIAPGDYNGLFLRATIALSEGELLAAERYYSSLLSVAEESQVYNNLGLTYMLNRKYEQAKTVFSKSLERAPDQASNLLNMADIEFLLGNEGVARNYYQSIIDRYSINDHAQDKEVQLVIAQALSQVGKGKEALEIIHNQLRNDPKNPITLFTASLVYSLLGEKTSSLLFAEKSIDQGMDRVWFSLPWFGTLCESESLRACLH